MKNHVNSFFQFINENKKNETESKATVNLEFDWTWADQMSKSEAAKAIKEEFDRIGMPNGLKILSKPELEGWGRRGNTPRYDMPYEASFNISFTGSRAEVKRWAEEIQLGEITIDFH